MIVSFSVANFRSFLSEETFSLVASKRFVSHEGHVIPIPDSDEKVLRTGVLYGANGAGKSNLFKAISYLQSVALIPRNKNSGTGREAFIFKDGNSKPSTFDLQFIAEGKLYRFGFKADNQRITEEWLLRVDGGREKIIYERTTDTEGKVVVDAKGLKTTGDKLIALATVGGPQNQSFLSTIYATLDSSDYGNDLKVIFDWFNEKLHLIEPNASFGKLRQKLAEDSNFLEFAGDFLKSSSTGVDHLKILKKEISEDELNSLLPKKVVSSILADMKDDSTEVTIKLGEGSELMVKKTSKRGEGSELLVEKNGNNHYYSLTIQAAHEHQIGKVIPLPLTEESDGTQRLLNLIPALHHLRTSSGVFFIDEIDRSMHPILVWKFLEFFLKSCNNCQCQIIVTTHESNLLDLDLLRRDEIWFAEKDLEGATRLYPLTDFKVRKDLEIRKHYMQGRFGAVPFLGNLDHLLENEGNPE